MSREIITEDPCKQARRPVFVVEEVQDQQVKGLRKKIVYEQGKEPVRSWIYSPSIVVIVQDVISDAAQSDETED